MMLWTMSDRAIPRSYRMMQGFGVHTYRMTNAQGESVFVKFHWTPIAGTRSLVWEEAVKISGADPDFQDVATGQPIDQGHRSLAADRRNPAEYGIVDAGPSPIGVADRLRVQTRHRRRVVLRTRGSFLRRVVVVVLLLHPANGESPRDPNR